MNEGPHRILHVIPSMGYGGAERQAAYLAHGLAGLGHDVHFALFAGGENLPLLEQSGATVHRLREAGNYDPRRLLELLRIAERSAGIWLSIANLKYDLAVITNRERDGFSGSTFHRKVLRLRVLPCRRRHRAARQRK